jgi:hypothetical protein
MDNIENLNNLEITNDVDTKLTSHELARQLLATPDCVVVHEGSWLKPVRLVEGAYGKDYDGMYYEFAEEDEDGAERVIVLC